MNRRAEFPVAALATLALLAATFLWAVSWPLNHDAAWLLEATRRWVGGERLYSDIIEINPPLILFENLLLTGGLLTKQAYLAGVCIVIGLSAFAVYYWCGAWVGAVTLLALVLPAVSDFGQRDHLALIFLAPFLLGPKEMTRTEQIAVGAWAFLGVGLKPHFALIPAAFILAQWVFNGVSAWRLQNIVVFGLCGGLVILTAATWPDYFTYIVPLGRDLYPYFTGSPSTLDLMACAGIALVGAVSLFRREAIGAATLAALLVYLLQAKFFHYQLIPALGLAVIAGLLGGWLTKLIGVGLLLVGPSIRPKPYPGPAIPLGTQSVLFLSDRVSAAYPRAFECGVRNASRYPTFWTVPIRNHPAFNATVTHLNSDLRKGRPEVIFNDTRLGRLGDFNFAEWADLSNYRRAENDGRFEIWLRRDLPLNYLAQPGCR